MRLGDIESKLSPVIEAYIKEVYPDLKDKPYPAVICLDDIQFKATLKVRDRKTKAQAGYNIPNNTLYFRNGPIEISVAHEVEHWAQAQRIGPDVYLERLHSGSSSAKYEREAEFMAWRKSHKLTGKY